MKMYLIINKVKAQTNTKENEVKEAINNLNIFINSFDSTWILK